MATNVIIRDLSMHMKYEVYVVPFYKEEVLPRTRLITIWTSGQTGTEVIFHIVSSKCFSLHKIRISLENIFL